MIVPLELSVLSSRKGYVSPELALGWRIGDHAREVFSGLDSIHMASRLRDDSALALSEMVRKESAFGDFKVVSGSRPWDVLCYHPQTGTTFAYSTVQEETRLPRAISDLERRLHAGNISVVRIYKRAVDTLIRRLLTLPLESLCAIHEYRVRKINTGLVRRRQYCPRCGLQLLSDGALWDVEGVVCCSACCGLEKSWITYH